MMGLMTEHATVGRWVDSYELAWRTPGTEGLAALFAANATYLHSPYEEPVVGDSARRCALHERLTTARKQPSMIWIRHSRPPKAGEGG